MVPSSIRMCQGVPQVGTRALTADEIALWSGKVVAHSRTRRGYRVLTWTAAVAMLICSGLLFDPRQTTLSEPTSLFVFGFASAGMWMLVAGAFGSLGEIIFGFNRLSRWGYTFVWSALGLTFIVELPNKVEALIGGSTAVAGLFGGCAALILRIVDLRRFAAIASELRQDLANGIAWQFAGESAFWEEDEYTTEDRDGAAEADRHHTADVLPHSSLALQIDGSATNGVMIKLLVTGPPPDDLLRSA